MKKHILTIVGARPQFIKASVISKAIVENSNLRETIVHTGQHFDDNMSSIFFNQLAIPRPDHQLNIHGGSHGAMTGRMLIDIEKIIQAERPDRVLVYGDTNSTLAGALAASKLHIPIAHIEAGLRSFNMRMPEEINRILTDQVSDILFCPTDTAVENLTNEGFDKKKNVEILQVGDVMQDAALFFSARSNGYKVPGLPDNFILTTLHRAENTDDINRLTSIVQALNHVHREILPIVLPLHPRTKAVISQAELELKVHTISPVGYLEMIDLLRRAQLVLTDSGGVQKEAFFFNKACVTLRDQTEWTELVDCGANVLAGAETEAIINQVRSNVGRIVSDDNDLYGGGHSSQRIIERLAQS